MPKCSKLWQVYPAQLDLRNKMSEALGIDPVVAQVLINRGINEEESARQFLYGGAELMSDPFLMQGMQRAVDRITQAIDGQEKITVYGDYDVDGITASAVLSKVLERLGATVEYYIPERQSEGYGLNPFALEQLHRSGTRLLVTVDCGISGVAEVAGMNGKFDIIITDHHQPPDILPEAYAILNPKQLTCSYPEKNLAGVGVAFKLCQALWRKCHPDADMFMDYLDIVALGTVADIVPLLGENRVLVKLGLAQLANTDNTGIQALLKVTGLTGGKVDVGKVGFVLAPRLNAAGRLSHAAAAVELLTTSDTERAALMAAELDAENTRRQAVEKELLAAAEATLAALDPASQPVLVLAGEDWHPGVIGIVASRLVDKYYRPVVMISVKEGMGKGSCRSIPGFDIYRALQECGDLLIQFGGHQQAAGLSIEAERIDAFRERLALVARQKLTAADFVPVLKIDSPVAVEEVNTAFVEQLASLSPHGMGNPGPVFVCHELLAKGIRPIGQEGKHLKLKVRRAGTINEVVAWNMGDLAADMRENDTVDLAFLPEINEWQGKRSIQLRAHDIHPRYAVPPQVRLVDARKELDKLEYIAQLAEQDLPVLILVNDRQEATRLRWHLWRTGLRAQVGCGERLGRGVNAPGLVIGILGCLKDPPDCGQVIMPVPPLAKDDLSRLFKAIGTGRQPVAIHFLYNDQDIKLAPLAAIGNYPDRAAIGWLYLILKELTQQTGGTRTAAKSLACMVQARGRCAMTADGAERALKILEELGLLRLGREPGQRIIYFAAQPATKLSLDNSSVYRASQKIRNELALFLRQLAETPVEDIWKRMVAEADQRRIHDGF